MLGISLFVSFHVQIIKSIITIFVYKLNLFEKCSKDKNIFYSSSVVSESENIIKENILV